MAANRPTPGEWTMIAGGAIALIASFVDGALGVTAWSDGAFPIVTLIPIYAGAVAVSVAFSRFGNRRLPPRVMGFTWTQCYLVLGTLASIMAMGWIVAGSDTSAGIYVMLVGALAVVAGALLSQRGRSSFRSIDGGL